MEVDEALGRLGTVGKWQITYYTVLSIAVMFPACWHMLAFTFIGGKPEHHCKHPADVLKENAIPRVGDGFSECKMYADFNDVYTTTDRPTVPCTEWEYNYTDIGHTIVSKWDLVCDRKYLRQTSHTIQIVGVMFGAMGFTALSDYFGRKPVFLFSQWALIVIGVANAFVTNYYGYVACRFIIGALQQGVILPGFVMACELFAAKYRTFAGIIIEDFWGVATCLLALFAYLIQDWVYLQLLISLLGILTIPLFWILPESVPWLCANNRVDEAERIIRNAAKMNGIEMPDRILAVKASDDADGDGSAANKTDADGQAKASAGNRILAKLNSLKKLKKSGNSEGQEPAAARYTLLDVFRNRRLTLYAISMAFLWMVITLVYYGLSLSAGELAGNRYINNFLSGLVEIPAYTASFFVLQRWGRRRPLIAFHCIAGVALILTQVIPTKIGEVSLIPLQLTLNMIGKFGITGAFGIVFLYAPEIFPTTLRSQAMGIASVTGRIGNMLSPFNQLLVEAVPWLPGPLFGVLSIVGGLVTLFLPETLNRPLPQTIEDIENWSKEDNEKKYKKRNNPDNQQEMQSVGQEPKAV